MGKLSPGFGKGRGMKRILFTTIIFLLVTQPAWATTYNIGPGQTYETFTALVATETLAAGDIVDGGGNEFWETWTPDGSGVTGNVITLQNATIHGGSAIKYNLTNDEYYTNGLGLKTTTGFVLNGDFTARTDNNFDGWTETVTGASTVVAETSGCYHGPVCAKLTDDAGNQARIGQDTYFTLNQKYEVTFWAKSDGTGTATSRFYEAANGLANTKTDGIYQTWSGTANITDLAVSATDTNWTQKTATILVENANHPATFQITTASSGGVVWIDDVRIRPIWTNYSGDIWQAATDTITNGAIKMAAFGGVPTLQAADRDSVTSSLKWFHHNGGTTHNYILYVYSTVNPQSSDEELIVSTGVSSYGVNVNDKEFITLSGLTVSDAYTCIGNAGTNLAILGGEYRNCATNLDIDSNNVHVYGETKFYYGDWIIKIGASSGVLIEDFEVYGAKKFYPGEKNEGGGIAPSVTAAEGDVVNLVVKNGEIHDCESYGLAEYGDGSTSANIINAEYYGLEIHDVLKGFWSQALANGITSSSFHSNVIYDPKSGSSDGILLYRSGNATNVYNNTVDGFTNNIRIWNLADSFVLKNNISSNPGTYHVLDDSATSFTLDYNLYYPVAGTQFGLDGTDYDFSDWQTNSSQDANSLTTDPLFVSTTDFRLKQNSPARKAGTGTKFNGLPADIGSYQTSDGFFGTSFFYSPGYPLGSTKNEVTIP